MEQIALGIFREIQHSPDRESDDYAILRAAASKLESSGVTVLLKTPEEVLAGKEQFMRYPPALVFAMCERENILALLSEWESHGVKVVNSTRAVMNTYRYRMVPLLEKKQIPVPRSLLMSTDSADGAARFLDGQPGCWIKRGDVHNTQKGDVTLCSSLSEIETRFKSFRERGISQAVLQENAPGDLIKFYGVSAAKNQHYQDFWYKWFYHKEQQLKNHPFSEKDLAALISRAAHCVDLEIFGGDAIIGKSGSIKIIDVNAWPSFALFREDASTAIAQCLALKFKKEERV